MYVLTLGTQNNVSCFNTPERTHPESNGHITLIISKNRGRKDLLSCGTLSDGNSEVGSSPIKEYELASATSIEIMTNEGLATSSRVAFR